MGSYASRFYQGYQAWGVTDPARVLILGLDGAGKTTIFYKMKLNHQEEFFMGHIMGFNLETIKLPNDFTITVWDMGRHGFFRHGIGPNYLFNTDGIIYVVDSNDQERLDEARVELHRLINDQYLTGVPVILLVNKQDISSSINVSEVTSKLGMPSLTDRTWHVHGCSAITGEGLLEGMEYFSLMVRNFKESKTRND